MEHTTHKRHKPRRVTALLLALALALPMGMAGAAGAQSAVAETGGILYETLGEAISAAVDGGTVRLREDLDLDGSTETLTIERAGALVLDLGGHILSGETPGPLVSVLNGQVTLHNGQIVNRDLSGAAAGTSGDGALHAPTGMPAPDWALCEAVVAPGYPVTVAWTGQGTLAYGESGNQAVVNGETLILAGGEVQHTFLLTPDTGWKVFGIELNGESRSPVTTLTIGPLTQATSLSVSFDWIYFALKPTVLAGDLPCGNGVVLTPPTQSVRYGEDARFDFTVNEGYLLKDVTVDGVSLGPVQSIELTEVTGKRDIRILLEKTALFILLDAGHFANYNHSPVVSAYYEGNEMWILHRYLEAELEKYPGIIVETTRPDNSKAIGLPLGPFDRGAMGSGYDLVLSLHSNACGSESVNRVVGITTVNKQLYAISRGIGVRLTDVVTDVMGVSQKPSVYDKAQDDGQDWYGINRGASSVGAPSLILEHSFHTNRAAATWLLSDSNKLKLAVAEAETIAAYFGIRPDGTMAAPRTPTGLSAYGYGYDKAMVKWQASAGASGYRVYRSDSPDGPYTRIRITSSLSFLDRGLQTGKVYYYKVRAYRTTEYGTKFGSLTAADSARPLPSKPKATVTPGDNKVTVKWNRILGADGYVVYRASGTTGAFVRVKTITKPDILNWTNTGLKDKAVYRYMVRAYRVFQGKTWFSLEGVSVKTTTL